jgi:hypothetical protein
MATVALSKGIPTDTTTIQLIETVAVVAIGLGVTGVFVVNRTTGIFTIIGGLVLLAITFQARLRRCAKNEISFETLRYTIPSLRDITLMLELPKDVHETVVPIYGQRLTRLDLAKQLRCKLGDARSAAFLPVVLSYADEVDTADAKKAE